MLTPLSAGGMIVPASTTLQVSSPWQRAAGGRQPGEPGLERRGRATDPNCWVIAPQPSFALIARPVEAPGPLGSRC
jgi:hypothetical protein